ncbi:MAG: ATP-binding protein [Candidatus Magnetoovum sp. WYHC-5]|nr:ATP-binding protein [Candidatus Magnetoovum sp. WYHC-5]
MLNINTIYDHIENKKLNYKTYDFTKDQGNALKAFFDLAQEYDNIEDLYNLCVAVVKAFFALDARLYLIDLKTKQLAMLASTENNNDILNKFNIPAYIYLNEQPYNTKESLVLPIKGKRIHSNGEGTVNNMNILGILEIYPYNDFTSNDILFFEKYANRVGFNIHNRTLAVKNIEHINFIKSLVADIEHNIIVPNMIFKLFLRRLNGKIMKNIEIERLFKAYHDIDAPCDTICIERIMDELTEVNHGLYDELQNIQKHYENTSLFLETLLRKSHFDKGHLTLRTKKCNMKKDIIEPQLERFLNRFMEMDIEVRDRLSEQEEETIQVLDIGLIAQVYANLFSNALKYTTSVVSGEKRFKYVEYGTEVLKNYFANTKDGIKYNVFSTGKHIKQEERGKIFEEGYRGTNTANRPGTGHGLTFIKNAVQIHGGVVGYEALELGNNFYFILPR